MSRSLDRRSFLRASAGAAAALTLRSPGVGAASSPVPAPAVDVVAPPPRFRKAVKLGMVHGDGSLLEKLSLLKELGFDGVEPDSPADLDADELVAARDATGLVIHGVVDSVHWRQPFSDPDPAVRAAGVAALRTALADAQRYGASTVLVVPAVVNKQVSYPDAYARSQEEIRKVLPEAAERGIRLAFENVWNSFLLSPLEFARYLDEFESPWVGAYFDVGNIVKYGWPEQWVRVLGPRILKIDVKGYSHREQFKPEIGEGDVDWPAVRTALAEVGYQGWATAEVGGGGRERLRDIAARMDRVLGLDG